MTKERYLKELGHYLRHLPKYEYDNAMAYFTEYFEDAGPENEQSVIADLGSPKQAAKEMFGKVASERSGWPRMVALVILAPVLVPIALLAFLLVLIFLLTLIFTGLNIILLKMCLLGVGISLILSSIVVWLLEREHIV